MEKAVTLPDADDMMQRLSTTTGLDDYTKSGFFPLIVQHASGRQLDGRGAVFVLTLAIAEYAVNRPPVLAVVLELQLPDFIRVLVDDETVKKEALDFLESLK